ncbi:MAG: hypothetical protein IKM78_02430 [Prevotella sp.]|nr:hypothetical protein [Prevotella sp.]
MQTKNFLRISLSMMVLVIISACSSNEISLPQSASNTIPYTVTVNGASSITRATVDNDYKTLRFAAGDKLNITGTNISGVLALTSGSGTGKGVFSGDLSYSGEGSPDTNLALTATLVSDQQSVNTEVSIDANGAVTVNYPTTSYCSDVATAVQKYSRLTGTSTYGDKAFTLSQQTAFLNFSVTFEDNTSPETELSVVVSNNNSSLCIANVTTSLSEQEATVANFVLPVPVGTTLTNAYVKIGDKDSLCFSDSEALTARVYNIKRTQKYPVAKITTAPTATTGDIIAGIETPLVTAGEAEGGTIKYLVTSENTKPQINADFTATVPTALSCQAGTYYVWYYVEADEVHTSSELSATGIEVTVLPSVSSEIDSMTDQKDI